MALGIDQPSIDVVDFFRSKIQVKNILKISRKYCSAFNALLLSKQNVPFPLEVAKREEL